MSSNLKVGMSFRVFEISDKHYSTDNIGKWFSEQNDEYKGNEYGVNAPLMQEHQKRNEHIGIDERGHGILKGILTIKTLKDG